MVSSPSPLRRRPPSTFQPRFSLGLIYFFGFFFLFCMLFATPALIEAYRNLPPGGASQEDLDLASQVAQRAVQSKLWIAFAATLASVALGAHTGALPGLRRRE